MPITIVHCADRLDGVGDGISAQTVKLYEKPVQSEHLKQTSNLSICEPYSLNLKKEAC